MTTRRKTKGNDGNASECVDLAAHVSDVFTESERPTEPVRRHAACPYKYEIKDGRMFIEGEDFGNCKDFFTKGRVLRDLVRTCHQIATA